MLKVTSFAQAMDACRLGPLHWKIFIFAALGIFMDGYDFFIIAAALPLIQEYWHPEPAMLGLIGAAATVGAVAGGALLGRFADIWGRRRVAMLTMTMFAVVSVASGLAWSVAALIAIRFVLGMAIGADYPTGAAYVAEFMPVKERPQLLFASLSFQALGAVAGAYVGILFVHSHNLDAWRWMLAAGFVPALLILILRGQLPESPRWLDNAGRRDEAKKVLSDLLQRPVELDIETAAPVKTLPFSALFSREFVGRTIFATVPWFCVDVALYGMALFTPIILASTGFGAAKNTFWSRDIHALRGALWLDIVLVAGFAAGIWLVKRAGVIRMQIAGFAGMIAGLGLVALGSARGDAWLIFAGFAVFNLSVNAGPNGTTYIVAAVEFPTSIRASGDGLASAAGKVGASVGIFLMPIMRASLGLTWTIVVVACVALTGLAVTVLLRDELYAGSRLALRGERLPVEALTEAGPA
ncbi:MAG: MFS transporter [Candidatus Eremiobacteraeota bacterium]|nr:MFS transporter [Candidatus Eremiobacteraeota bacterium]